VSLSHRCSACGKAAENAEKARISLLVRGVRVNWENIFAVCAGVEFSCKAVFRKNHDFAGTAGTNRGYRR